MSGLPMSRPFATGAALLLTACGGGTGGSLASAPLPPSQVEVPNDTTVELLDHPSTQEFVVVTKDNPFSIRYDAASQRYSIKAGSLDWATLIDSPGASQEPNIHFRIAGQPDDTSWVTATAHFRYPPTSGAFRYRYSNLLSWTAEGARKEWDNYVALGIPTPATGVPVSGSASFEGRAKGDANVPNDGWGKSSTTPVDGEVSLFFDFAAGSLSGSLKLWEACDCTTQLDVGPVAFTNTQFARGSESFSGAFLTNAPGENAFQGRLNGPQAEELMASWALPFTLDGTVYQATGVWIAKQ